jgi:hypothetical protein
MNDTLNGIMQYFGAMPPPYNQAYDLNKDGFITILDLLIALSL